MLPMGFYPIKGILTEKQFKFQSMANVSLLLIVRA